MLKAVAYPRFSSDNQREESITAQLRAIREYANKNDIEIVAVYRDEAFSATTDDRPGFLQMISDIVNDRIKVDLVLVHKVDRFARNRYDAVIYRQKLQRKKVKVFAVDQQYDADTPEGALMESLFDGMAEFYSKNLSREIKKGKKENVLAAKHDGGVPALGYNVNRETMEYIINPAESEIVKAIFEMTASGSTYDYIVAQLNSKGYQTKTGGKFAKNSIHDILRNPKYGGYYVANRYTDADLVQVDKGVPAIVEPDLWGRVQEMMDGRKHNKVYPRKKSSLIYILTGKIICGECGAHYSGNSRKSGKGNSKYVVYNCVNKRQKKTCDNRDIFKDAIENAVLDDIEAIFNGNMEELADAFIERYGKQSEEMLAEIANVRKLLAEASRKTENLWRAIEDGAVDNKIAGPRLEALNNEKIMLEKKLAQLEEVQEFPFTRDQVLNYLNTTQHVLADRNDPMLCKRLVDIWIQEITITKTDVKIVKRLPLYRMVDENVSKMVDHRGLEPRAR